MVARLNGVQEAAGSTPVTRTTKKSLLSRTKDSFLNDVFRCAERDAHFVRDASCGRDVRFARETEHITSLRGNAAKHHGAVGTTSLAALRQASLFHRLTGRFHFIISSTEVSLMRLRRPRKSNIPKNRDFDRKSGIRFAYVAFLLYFCTRF